MPTIDDRIELFSNLLFSIWCYTTFTFDIAVLNMSVEPDLGTSAAHIGRHFFLNFLWQPLHRFSLDPLLQKGIESTS